MGTRLSVKKVNKVLSVLRTSGTEYRLTRWEHPTGTGCWYSYCIIKVSNPETNEQHIDYIMEDATLRQCYEKAFEMMMSM